MSPIAHKLIKIVQNTRNSVKRHTNLNATHEATKQPDLAHFTIAKLTDWEHASPSDPRPHITVLLATEEQAKNNKCQPVHIYLDANRNYTDHLLFPERNDD